MAFNLTAATIWRQFVTDGAPVSGAHKPVKAQIRQWGAEVEDMLRQGLRAEMSLAAAQSEATLESGMVLQIDGRLYDVTSASITPGPTVFAHNTLGLRIVLGPAEKVRSVKDLRLDTRPAGLFAAGLLLEAAGHVYEVAPADSTDHDFQTAGGTKLYYRPHEKVDIRAFADSRLAYTADWPNDWSPALQRAYAVSVREDKLPIYMHPDQESYVVTHPLDVSAGDFLLLHGARRERARGAQTEAPGWNGVTISWQPASDATWFIDAYSTAAPTSFIGPFELHNVGFLLGGNGFRFGRRDVNLDGTDDVVVDGAGQAYIFGVHIKGCSLQSSRIITRNFDANYELPTQSQVLVAMAKCFESIIEDTSFQGGTKQIELYGCDRPVISNVRAGRCRWGIEIWGSGSFAVDHVIENYQIEQYTVAALTSLNAVVSVNNFRAERQGAANNGAVTLTQTASVTADSDTITFSASVAQVFTPWASVIKVTNPSGQSFFARVKEVNGSTATIRSNLYFKTPWTATGCTVERYDGYCILSGGVYDFTSHGGSFNPNDNCPTFIYEADKGTMFISGAKRQKGLETSPLGSIVIGNRQGVEPYLNPRMTFVGCTPNVTAGNIHPFVHAVDMGWPRGPAGTPYAQTIKTAFGDPLEAFHRGTRRTWTFTPKNAGVTWENSHLIPLSEEVLDPVTTEKIWVWKKAATQTLILRDETIASGTHYGAYIRMRVLAAGDGAGAALSWNYQDNGGTPVVEYTGLADRQFRVYEDVREFPAEWAALGPGPRGIVFDDVANSNVLIAAVTLELLGVEDGLFAGGTWQAPLRMGARVIWFDASGNLRAKASVPANATDGTVISAAAVT